MATDCVLGVFQHGLSDGGLYVDRRATADKPVPWLSDWRLKLASGSWQLYQELWMELSGAAAACYAVCGRKRNAALLRYVASMQAAANACVASRSGINRGVIDNSSTLMWSQAQLSSAQVYFPRI